MGEQRRQDAPEPHPALGPGTESAPESVAERLYADYERLRLELARLRGDVRRLSEAHDADSDDDESADKPAQRGIAAAISAHPVRFVIALLALAVAMSAGLRIWQFTKTFQSTEDAQIDAHIDPISPRIAGTVVKVLVANNQRVKVGQPLVEIDPRANRIAVEKARAILDTEQGQYLATQQDAAEARAMMVAAQANAKKAASDSKRFEALLRSGVISPYEMDQYAADTSVSAAQTDAARAAWHSLTRDLAARKAAVLAARAALDQATLNLSHTRISAPVAGIVGKLAVEVGQRVQAGEELLAIVRDQNLWVTANFKETQLERIFPGDRATIHVDAFDRDFQGEVQSIAGASGAKYSILPPENATGNYVKVVQRIPIRIRLLPGQPDFQRLRAGMSVEATVWLK